MIFIHNRNHIRKPIYFQDSITPGIMFEKWLPVEIEGVVPNYYFVSNLGNVKNIKGQIIYPTPINSGYYRFALYTGSKPKYKYILAHRLVMLTHHPIENSNQYTINHYDMDASNNMEYNLEWMSQGQNNQEKVDFYCQYGSNRYNSFLSREELPLVVNEINKGTSYANILKMLNKEDTRYNRDYIGNIKRGITYKREMKDLGLEITI